MRIATTLAMSLVSTSIFTADVSAGPPNSDEVQHADQDTNQHMQVGARKRSVRQTGLLQRFDVNRDGQFDENEPHTRTVEDAVTSPIVTMSFFPSLVTSVRSQISIRPPEVP